MMMTTPPPAPGQPLSEADVSLLQPGDWLLHKDGTVHRVLSAIEGWVFVADWREPIRAFTFLGRPDQDGWIAWHGGENPVPGVKVEVRLRSGDEFTGSDVNAEGTWRHIWGEGDIIAYRPHAPVSRPGDGVEGMPWLESALIEHLRSMGCKCPSPLIGYRPNTGPRCRLCNIEPVSRPAGEGETTQHTPRCWGRTSYSDEMAHCYCKPAGEGEREAVAILKGIGKIDGDGWKDTTTKGEVVYVWNAEKPSPYAPGQYPRIGNVGWSASTSQYDFTPATADDVPAILALIRPAAPDAGGGEDKRDAERFRALMRCGRIKMQGSSGVDPHTLGRNGNNVHFGAEFWPEPYDPAQWEATYGQSTRWGRACLMHLADAIIEQEAAIQPGGER